MILQEVSSSVIKNTYKVFTKLLFNNDATKGEQVMTKNDEPVLVMGGAQQTANQFCERMLADALFHNNADRRFEPGAARIAISECNWNPLLDENPNLDAEKLGILKNILNYITEHHNDRDVISNDLNGKTYQELYNNFGTAVKQAHDAKNTELDNIKFNKPEHEYKIIRIDSFEESKKYHDYTNPKSRWCLTYSIENYNAYMNYGKNTMYFCLRDDINTVEYKIGENCPLDEYGKSMLCVIVNPYGELNTFTTRWNHKDANGKGVAADKGVGDKKTISELIGANFNEVFVPDAERVKHALEIDKRYHLNNIDDLNEDDSSFVNEIIRNLEDFNDELVDDYDPDSDETDPDDMNWSDILDRIDWDFRRVFGEEIASVINSEKCSAFENVLLICTSNNFFKLMYPVIGRYRQSKSITNWCDDIKPIRTGRENGIFAVKEHNDAYYKLITIDLTYGNLKELQLDFENKILFAHEPNNLSNSDELFITFPDNKLGLVVFSRDCKNAYLKVKDIDLPKSFITNNNQAHLICGEHRNNNLLFKIKNNDTGKFNLVYQKHNFKLELAPEDEFDILCNEYELKRYVKNMGIDDITTMNIPLLVYDENKRYLIDLKTFKPLFDKKGNVDNTDDVRIFFRATDEEKFSSFRDKLDKHNLEIYYFNKDGSIDTGKIDNIYCSVYMYTSLGGDNSKYKGKIVAFGYTNPECTKFEIFDIEGNILYKNEEPLEYLESIKPENKKHVVLQTERYKDLILYCFRERSSYGLSNDILQEISKTISSAKNESVILKYAAYLLD